ncbi:MAG: hypothetical protein HUJ53_05960 [Holdemanella sp.]|nr:hypothetical protein [Holdemanella sp.]
MILFWIVGGIVLAYIMTPEINIKSGGFIFWAIFVIGLIYLIAASMIKLPGRDGVDIVGEKVYQPPVSKTLMKGATLLILISVLWVFVSPIVMSKVFHASSYASRIQVKDVEFSEVKEVDFTKTPIIDRASTSVLGDRVMGQMPELVSQFEVSDEYTQISYDNSVYRVTPLEYAGFIKYLGNRKEGIPAYIKVNSVTGEAELVKLKDLGLSGMKYVPSAYFNENLHRRLQILYPTTIFGDPSFEIDDEGHPWYVCTTYDYSAYLTKKKVTGVILFDPITGDSQKYEGVDNVPNWVDRIYPESLIIEEIDNNGSLQSGFINSIFGQKNVMVTSEGYNYLAQDGDIYIYSGITSANSDSSNLGFVLVNLRTHAAMRIKSPGANENSAMNSAEGEVKNYGYDSTFPLLISVQGKPVYMMALKDDSGLIKMYAMVDATNYQKVATIESDEGFNTLKKKFIGQDGDEEESVSQVEKTIEIASIQYLTVSNSSKCFLVDKDGNKYKVIITSKNEDILAFLKTGDTVTISFVANEDVNIIKKITK